MRVIHDIEAMRSAARMSRRAGRTIGLVPTMGALHPGHLSLVGRSVAENDVTVVSIFVNPLQFGPGEDLTHYPRDLDADARLLEGEGVDIAFAVAAEEMYPEGFATTVAQDSLTGVLCGRSRPGHFRGVTTVCTKLFHIVQPDRVYFGRKDYQQSLVIGRMLRDLDFGITMKVLPIVREPDGLALSSRNRYLSPEDRRRALALSEALRLACEAVGRGERRVATLEEMMRRHISGYTGVEIDYVEIRDAESLGAIGTLTGRAVAAVAARVGGVRLIDNEILLAAEP